MRNMNLRRLSAVYQWHLHLIWIKKHTHREIKGLHIYLDNRKSPGCKKSEFKNGEYKGLVQIKDFMTEYSIKSLNTYSKVSGMLPVQFFILTSDRLYFWTYTAKERKSDCINPSQSGAC